MTEYAKFDSASSYENRYARLTKDAEVKSFGDGKESVRITFVDTSRNENDADMWIEAQAPDRMAEKVKHLKKGDVVDVEGKLSMRRYGDNNEKVAFSIRFAEIRMSPELQGKLKERGYSGAGGNSKPAAKPAPKKPTPTKAARPTVDLPEDDDIPF